MGLTIKTDKNNPDLYKVYSPSPKRSDPKIGTVTQGEDGKWYFVPTLGVHAFDTDELSELARIVKGFSKGTAVTTVVTIWEKGTVREIEPTDGEYTFFVPRDPYDVD